MRGFSFLLSVAAILLIGTTAVNAGDSKMEEVDLDEDSTVLIKADLEQDDLYYYIDKTACNCYLRVADKHYSGITQVDCWNLRKHKKLEKHVTACKTETPKVQLTDASIEAIALAYRSIASNPAAGKSEAETADDEDNEVEDGESAGETSRAKKADDDDD